LIFSPSRFPSATRPALLAICAIALTLAVRLAGQSAAQPLQLLSRDGRRTMPVTVSGSQEMLALDDLARAFQLTVRDDGGAITVAYKGRTIVLTADQTIASVAGRLISLPAPPVRVDGRWLVPVEFLNRALASIYDARLDLRRASHLLVIGDLRVPRVSVRLETTPTTARVTLDVVPSANPAISQQGTSRLVVRLDADALDLSLPAIQAGPLVQAGRSNDASSVAIDLGPRFASFRSATAPIDDGIRVTVDLVGDQPETAPAPSTTTTQATPGEAAPPDLTGNVGLRTIAIDAGHGGGDSGATGANGTLEKNVSLAVARRVKAALEARLGVRVVMTRDDDRGVAIESRTALANNNKADLFVSLHANASFRPEASGATIYVASLKELAVGGDRVGSERLPVFGGGMRTIEILPWGFSQIPHQAKSDELAQAIATALTEKVPVSTRVIEHAPLRLLESANMPAVLVEMGYLTNAQQEAALAGSELQAALAQSLVDAIARFREAQAAAAPQAGR
jgi:N-acetylmuramoyl-L-alanine amidase